MREGGGDWTCAFVVCLEAWDMRFRKWETTELLGELFKDVDEGKQRGYRKRSFLRKGQSASEGDLI